jgi:hypothetical protein
MEQSPFRQANTHSASQEISHPLPIPKFHSCVHKSLPLVRILSQMHQDHIFKTYSHKIRSNTVFPSKSNSSKQSFLFKFSDQNFVCMQICCSLFNHEHNFDLLFGFQIRSTLLHLKEFKIKILLLFCPAVW